MAPDLGSALDQQQFVLHYLREVDAASGEVLGVEALLRWEHPQQGLVYPLDVLNQAGASLLIARLSLWTVGAACARLADWNSDPVRRHWTLALNVEPGQLEDPEFAPAVIAIVQNAGIDPHKLWMEVTERAILNDWRAAAATVAALGTLGIPFGLDNFGIGYASLAYLRQLPFSYLKTPDPRLSSSLDAHHLRLLDAEIAMAKGMGLQVIAKGIETEVQRELFRGKGIDRFQGYLFGRPLPADQLP